MVVGAKGKEKKMSKQRDVEQRSRPPVGDDALERRSVIAALAATMRPVHWLRSWSGPKPTS